MAWIYLAESVESPKPYRPGLDQSPFVKQTNTLNLCCFHAWLGASCFQLPFGTTCEHFEAALLSRPESTSSTAASHARTLVLREMVQVWRESEADFSSKSPGLFASYDQLSRSWKMSQLSLFEDSQKSLESLPSSGMTLGGRLFQPKNLEPVTLDDDGSCLPTPMASACGYQSQGNGEKRYMIPQLWKMGKLPTPMAREWRSAGSKSDMARNSPSVSTYWKATTGTTMPPSFIEWIMGYRIGATASEDWATQWFQSKQGKHSKDSQDLEASA